LGVVLANPVPIEVGEQSVELVEARGVVRPDFGVEGEDAEVFEG